MRVLPFVLLVTLTAGCRSGAPAPASAPGPSPAQSGPVVGMQVVERVSTPAASDTSARARAMREGQRRAAEAAARVAAIAVAPQQLNMTVGESLPFTTLRVSATDSARRPIEGFAPAWSAQDNTILSLRGGVITALEPGTTNLRVSAMTFPTNPGTPAAQRPLTVLVPVTVTAGATRTTVTRPPVHADSMIPMELVRYLMGASRLTVGQPISVLDGATLQGAYVHGSRYSAGGATTIASYPWTRRATLDSLQRRLGSSGWSLLPPPQSAAQQPGFQGSNLSMGMGGTAFCRQRELLVLSVPDARGTETVISFNHQSAQGRGPCDPAGRPQSLNASTLVPSLVPMTGESTIGRGSGGSSEDGYVEAMVMSTLPVLDLLDHYHRQLQAAGWTPVERTSVSGVAIATYSFRDSTSRPWGAVFTVLTAPGANRTDLRIAVRHTP